MFSSLVSYVSSSLSPKAWLAHYIAQGLNEFFLLDDQNGYNNSSNNNSIEANLLKDTKIVLHNVAVRPRSVCNNNACLLYGTVEQMELSWTWGGNGGSTSNNSSEGTSSSSSSFVRDTRLTIRGAKFRIEIGGDLVGETPSPTAFTTNNNNSSKSSSESSQRENNGYLQRHLQQIMEHLTLDISDVTLVVEDMTSTAATSSSSNTGPTPIPSRVCLDARGLQLISFGRQQEEQQQDLNSTASAGAAATPPPPPLSQRLSLASIAIYLEKDPNDKGVPSSSTSLPYRLPILDPIGYAASVKRVAGRRFLDGWANGLEIVGEILSGDNDDDDGGFEVVGELLRSHSSSSSKRGDDGGGGGVGFVLYAGVEQVQTLGEMMSHLNKGEKTTTIKNSKNQSNSPSLLLERKTSSRSDSCYDCQSDTASNSTASSTTTTTTAPATTIRLPLPSITVVLPNNNKHKNDDDMTTTIRMPQCNFAYSMDGSKCHLYGSKGVWLGQEPLVAFSEEEDDTNKCEWVMDWITRQVSLKRRSPTTTGKTTTTHDNSDRSSVAHVHWNDENMKQLFQRVLDIASAIPVELSEQVETAVHEYSSTFTTTRTQPTREEQDTGPAWSFVTNGPIALTATCQDEWIQAKLGAIKVELSLDKSSNGFPFSQFNVAGIDVGPTSLGESKDVSSEIRIPAFSLQTEASGDASSKPKLLVKGELSATLESKQVGIALYEFCKRLLEFPTRELPLLSGMSERSSENYLLLHAEIPRMSLCIVKESMKILLNEVTVDLDNGLVYGGCSSVNGWSGTHEALFMNGIKVKNKTSEADILVEVQDVSRLCLPGILDAISEPIRDVSVHYRGSEYGVKVQSRSRVLAVAASGLFDTRVEYEQSDKGMAVPSTALPFPVQVEIPELKLQPFNHATASLWVANLVAKVEPSGDKLSLGTNGNVRVRVVDSVQNAWVEGTIGPFTALLTATGHSREPELVSCEFVTIGPCSYGKLQLSIPAIKLSDNRVTVGDISGSLDSLDLALRVQSLWRQLVPPPPEISSLPPYMIRMPKVVLSVLMLKATTIAENSVFNGRDGSLNCGRFGIQNESGLAAAFSGLHTVIYPTLKAAEIQVVDCFYIPGVCSLENPLRNPINVAFEDDSLRINIPPVDLILLDSKSSDGDCRASEGSVYIPFPLRLNLQHLSVKSFSQEGDITHIDQLAFDARPQENVVVLHAVISRMENKLMKVSKTNASGMIIGGNLATIHHFKLVPEAAEVAAGFSSMDWSNIFGSEASRKASTPVALPFCRVEPFTAHLQYRGAVIGVENTAVRVHELVGTATTNTNDLIQHLKKSVLDRAPAMLTNAKIFGQSVSEMAATTAGGAYLAASTMPMAAAGCVAGIAAHDSIRGSIAYGKSSRGVTAGDSYQIGDFSRGVVHSVQQTARSGSEARRGSKDYQFGDFSVGASKSVSNYASQNKSRLGSAGGSGAGMLVGFAVAGPLGLVAGSLLGSKLGRSAFEDEQKPEGKRSQTTEQTVNSADADLLGIGATPPGSTGTPGTAKVPAKQINQQEQQQRPQPPTQQQHRQQHRRQQQQQNYQPPAHPPSHAQQQQQHGYRFGDFTKGVVAKGKGKSGRSDSDSYKFGDFTRGLFG